MTDGIKKTCISKEEKALIMKYYEWFNETVKKYLSAYEKEGKVYLIQLKSGEIAFLMKGYDSDGNPYMSELATTADESGIEEMVEDLLLD